VRGGFPSPLGDGEGARGDFLTPSPHEGMSVSSLALVSYGTDTAIALAG